jgi:hypothetical protein
MLLCSVVCGYQHFRTYCIQAGITFLQNIYQTTRCHNEELHDMKAYFLFYASTYLVTFSQIYKLKFIQCTEKWPKMFLVEYIS